MRRVVTPLILVLALSSGGAMTAFPASAQQPERIPFEAVIPAEQGCGIEDILIKGTILHWISDGPEPSIIRTSYQGVSGIGLTTGIRYSVTLTNISLFVVREPGEELVFHSVSTFSIVSQGSAPNYKRIGHFLSTTLPDGTVKVRFKFEEGCQ